MNMSGPEWVAIVAPFASGALGVGAAYGFIRAHVSMLKERLDKVDERLEKQVGEARCKEYRETCRTEWQRDIERIEAKQDRP